MRKEEEKKKQEEIKRKKQEEMEKKKRKEQEEREKKKRKEQKILLIFALGVPVGFIILFFVIIPGIKYIEAGIYMKQSNYSEALVIYSELDGYLDSEDMHLKALVLHNIESDSTNSDGSVTVENLLSSMGEKDCYKELCYIYAKRLLDEGNHSKARIWFKNAGDYEDAADMVNKI